MLRTAEYKKRNFSNAVESIECEHGDTAFMCQGKALSFLISMAFSFASSSCKYLLGQFAPRLTNSQQLAKPHRIESRCERKHKSRAFMGKAKDGQLGEGRAGNTATPHANPIAAAGGVSAEVSALALAPPCGIERLHQRAANPVNPAHQPGLIPSAEVSLEDLRAVKHFGLKAQLSSSASGRPALILTSALARIARANGFLHTVILAQTRGQRVPLQDPGSPVGLPIIEPLEVSAGQRTGELILLTSRPSLVGELAKFDLSRLVPSLVNTASGPARVLLSSFMLQLSALVGPLFFQVVKDKVSLLSSNQRAVARI